jgi:hypothetical protein
MVCLSDVHPQQMYHCLKSLHKCHKLSIKGSVPVEDKQEGYICENLVSLILCYCKITLLNTVLNTEGAL